MIPKYGCLLLGLLTVCGAAAQHPDDEYYPYAARQEERTPLLLTDSTLFYRAVQTTPALYAEHTAFNLPYVSVKRRGLNYRIRFDRGRAAFVALFRGNAPVGGR